MTYQQRYQETYGGTEDGQPLNESQQMNGDSNHDQQQSPQPPQPQPQPNRRKASIISGVTIAVSILVLILCGKALFTPSSYEEPNGIGTKNNIGGGGKKGHGKIDNNAKRMYDEHGRYIIEDYDTKPPFSDFLPSVAGIYGKPLWTFYVNRGQAITSFGIKSKEYPILEFYSANKAYQNTALLGFRTFLQGSRGSHSFLTEPFSPARTYYEGMHDAFFIYPKRYMYVGANEVQIRETDVTNRIEINITYFTLPEEDFGALVRRTTITNLDKQEPLVLSMLDGLARMEPAGGKLNSLLKFMGRTLEAWMGVYQADESNIKMPYYRMSTETDDTAAVKVQQEGHYCLAFIEGKSPRLLPIIYDASKVFGDDTMMLHPTKLNKKTVGEIISEEQYGFAQTSSAFAAVESVTVEPGNSITIASFYGLADRIKDVPAISRRITNSGFVQYKFARAREIINQIIDGAETQTKNSLFNGVVKQMFMDNSLRGGVPIILGEENDDDRLSNADENKRLKVYHLFSRIHGDVERDYNDFEIVPTFFSQGPGNFRDIAQNRRIDVIFNPRIGSFDVKMFLSLIQADGYNPLSVESAVFSIKDKQVCDEIAAEAIGRAETKRTQREALSGILHKGPFRPGQLFELMKEQLITPLVDRHTFINRVAAASEISPMGVYKTGFWSDHWTYIMDLVKSYLSIYPDGEEHLLYDQQLPYFFSPASVLPRSEKYVLSLNFDGIGYHVRQLDATAFDSQKENYLGSFFNNATGWYDDDANWQHTADRVAFKSSTVAKLFLLATVKFATRDAFGMGIEYEAGRPGWNDALNGLVGMIGSGMPETYELDFILRYIKSVLDKYNRPIILPGELCDLINSINAAIDVVEDNEDDGTLNGDPAMQINSTLVPSILFQYWDTVSAAREDYREKTRVTFSGVTEELSAEALSLILDRWINQVGKGIARAMIIGYHGKSENRTSGLTPTYFSYNITKWKRTGQKNQQGHALVSPLEMEVSIFPLFLEGPARMMKTADKEKVLNIYNDVKTSNLHDEKLKMYKISESLAGQSIDMGRVMVFPPGWLENESIWVHLSYKFYLELIRKGLYKEFYEELTSGGMFPFMKPDVYGRSPMECSSFIASSAFADPSKQGRGFLPRLSGTTAEFLSMWALMMIGPEPFFVDQTTNQLNMQLIPALPLWLFQEDGTSEKTKKDEPNIPTVSFKLFSSISVTYYNSLGTDLFGISPKMYEIGLRDGSILRVNGPIIPTDIAISVRRVVLVNYIDAFF